MKISHIGIGGEKCDQCAPGFVQEAQLTEDHPVQTGTIPYGENPNCVECGECFTNWNRILDELRMKTEKMVERAEQVKVGASFYILTCILM